MVRNLAIKWHSHPVKYRERVKLRCRECVSELARGTHSLLSIERVSSYNMKRKLAIKGHSQPVKCKRRVKLIQKECKQLRGLTSCSRRVKI
jgi:hypothetical protein